MAHYNDDDDINNAHFFTCPLHVMHNKSLTRKLLCFLFNRCGMVALAMASELAGDSCVTTEDILSEAIKRGFSKCGEMFSGL